jgi:hypothetical protein
MKDTTPSLDLSALENDYHIVGELDPLGNVRRYIGTRTHEQGKRREDRQDVLIEVFTTPAGDEANALSHLAADTQLLARTPHRRLIPIVEGRWIGDAFAIVRQRIPDSSLAQRLAMGEKFTTPRVAAILREVNGVLEWAREQRIVHRGVTPDTLYLEPKTDRVRLAFGVSPIRRIRDSNEDEDARTIARLAVAMLTGEVEPQRDRVEWLAEQRPDLPARVIETTAALLDEKQTGSPADVVAYIAMIGMADPIFAGESERDRIRAEILEEQRLEREKIANERAEFERTMAAERAAFDKTMTDERARLEAERARLERAVSDERASLQRSLATERSALAVTRAALERSVAERVAEIERVAAQDRRSVEALRVELRRAGELEIERKRQAALEEITDADDTLDREELTPSPFMSPVFAPLDPLVFDDETPVMSREKIDFAPPPEELTEEEDVTDDVTSPTDGRTRRNWILAGSAAALVAVVGISAVVIGNGGAATQSAAPVARAPSAPLAAAPAMAPPPSIVPLPVAPRASIVDSSAGRVGSRLDSGLTQPPRTDSARAVAAAAARRDSAARAARAAARATRTSPVAAAERRDSTVRRVRAALAEDIPFIPGGPPPRRDSVARPDTSPKRR